MHKLALILISALSLASSSAFAASYQQTDGTIVDPIQLVGGGDHPHSGSDLGPFGPLSGADLSSAVLNSADLVFSDLSGADLIGAVLNSADLSFADLTGADLTGADLTGAILASAFGLGSSFGSASYDINTDFTDTGFDPVAAGWTLVPIPEPSTALLMGLGLAGLAVRRR